MILLQIFSIDISISVENVIGILIKIVINQ